MGNAKLTNEQREALHAEIRAGGRPKDLGPKYGITPDAVRWHTPRAMGRPLPPSQRNRSAKSAAAARSSHPKFAHNHPKLEEINEAILAGKTAAEIAREFNLNRKTISRMRAEMSMNKGERELSSKVDDSVEMAMDQESIRRTCDMLGRLARKHPRVFAEINPLKRLATKYPNILMEVL